MTKTSIEYTNELTSGSNQPEENVGRGRYGAVDRLDQVIALRCSTEQKKRWKEAARAEGLATTSWVKWQIERIISEGDTHT